MRLELGVKQLEYRENCLSPVLAILQLVNTISTANADPTGPIFGGKRELGLALGVTLKIISGGLY